MGCCNDEGVITGISEQVQQVIDVTVKMELRNMSKRSRAIMVGESTDVTGEVLTEHWHCNSTKYSRY